MAKTFTVVYRVGGTENFKWCKALPVWTREEAIRIKAEVERGGRPAMVFDTKLLDAVGLPETYDAKSPIPE